MTNFTEYINPELLILVPVLYLIGMGIKKSAISDRWIPLLLGACGIILASIYVVAIDDLQTIKDVFVAIFIAITQGVLVAGASVYANQIVKQALKDDDLKTDINEKGE